MFPLQTRTRQPTPMVAIKEKFRHAAPALVLGAGGYLTFQTLSGADEAPNVAYTLLDANINANDFGGGRPPMLAMSARAMSADAPVPMEAGLTAVTVTVSGSVQLN